MKKSHYLENGLYYDITTGRTYQPKNYCEICGCKNMLTVHHFLKQQKCLKDLASKRVITPSTWTQDFINKNQKLFTFCLQCHHDVDFLSDEKFKEKYNIERSEFIYK